mmetsp:Transcript_26112/g.34302  ORF Transcript_26112/g.34302 Transcript_26112/m.34302 type:complete len:410 (+) Transcript_26112:198-1427(+)
MSKPGDDEAFDKMMAEIDDSDEDSDDDDDDLENFYGAQAKTQSHAPGTAAPNTSYSSGLVAKQWEGEDDVQFGNASSAAVQNENQEELGFNALKAFLTKSCRSGDPFVQCYVDRDRNGMNRLAPIYRLYIEPAGGLEDGQEGRFLVAAKKRGKNKTSNYLISMDMVPTDRSSNRVVGKLRANWSGSEYTIYDHGLNPEKCSTPSMIRRELGLVKFEYDEMGPGRMRCFIPSTSGVGVAQPWRPQTEEETISHHVEQDETDQLMTLENKRPKWDEGHGGHVLNFGGRVTESSVKNFQMFCHDTDDDTTLQFGRVGKNRFTLDFQYPLSPLQAFAICLASLDGKLADSKGYESVKKMGAEKGATDNYEGEEGVIPARQGTMRGSTGLTGAIRDRAPSKQYVMDKLKRMSKK